MICETCNDSGEVITEIAHVGRYYRDKNLKELAHDWIRTGRFEKLPCFDCKQDD